MPAVPALITGGAALGSTLLGSKAASSTAKQAQQRSPEELGLIKSQTSVADQQRSQGSQLFDTAMPAIKNTLGYYQTLLGGNRSARMAAVSPEAQDTEAAYSGADKLVRKRLTGGERNTALAENARAKSGQIARLTTGVRPGVAAATGGMGMQLAGTGVQGLQGAGGIYSGLLGNETQNRQGANLLGYQAGSATSRNIGGLIASLLKQYPNKGGGTKYGGSDSI